MSRIGLTVARDFKRILAFPETPTVIVRYNTRVGGTVKIGYGSKVGGTVTAHTATIKAIMTDVDEWNTKRLPYADLKVGQSLFYIDLTLDLSTAEDITVQWGDRKLSVKGVRPAIPIGSSYIAQVLIT